MPSPLEQALLFVRICTELEIAFIVRAQQADIQEQGGSCIGIPYCMWKTKYFSCSHSLHPLYPYEIKDKYKRAH